MTDPLIDTCAAVVYDVAYIFGGVHPLDTATPLKTLLQYRFPNDLWGTIPEGEVWPAARMWHSMVAYGSKLYVFGGLSANRLVRNDFWVYSTSGSSWAQINASNAPPRRHGHTATVVGSRMWIVGGRDDTIAGAVVLYDDIWYWDFGGQQWTQVSAGSTKPSARSHHIAVPQGDFIWIYGGIGSSTFSDMWRFQVTANGPAIISFFADDPNDGDAIYRDGDTLTIVFDQPTNRVPVSSTELILASFQFIPYQPGTILSGAWKDAMTLEITVEEIFSPAPVIGNLTVTVIGDVRDAELNTRASRSTSPVLTGDWGTKPGPKILQFYAHDPDNLDVFRSNGDMIVIVFDVSTSQPYGPKPSRAQLLSLFSFSQELGNAFSGTWMSSFELAIELTDVTGATATIGSLTVTVIGPLYNLEETSLPSNSVSAPLSGDWGVRPGPKITSMTASDPLNDDGIYNAGDEIVIVFSEPTNKPTSVVYDLFSFSDPMGAALSGFWVDSSTFRITVDNPSGGAPVLNRTTATVKISGNLRDENSWSSPSNSTSPLLAGDFGTLAGPTILSIEADDPDDLDAVFGDGDTITVRFSEATSQPLVGSKATLDALFTPSSVIGQDYQGIWITPDVLVIKIVSHVGGSPQIGVFTLTICGGITNAAGTSLPSCSQSPQLFGDWGTCAGPVIVDMIASDPDNGDGIYSDGDLLTIVFDKPTNAPPVSSYESLQALLHFSEPLGVSAAGTWANSSTVLLISIVSSLGGSPVVGSLVVTVIGDLRDAAGTSLRSDSSAVLLNGNWGTKDGPDIIALVADDPDNGDAVFSVGDTITVIFD
jgi:hypothetical protein